MPELDIKDAMLTRQYELKNGDEVWLYVWKPFHFPDVPDEEICEHYMCYFQIKGIGYDKVRRSVGVDSIQALMLALKMAGAYLYASQSYKTGDMTYLGQRDLDLSLSDGMEADRVNFKKADVLTSPGGDTIIRLPDDRFASIVFDGNRLNGLVKWLAEASDLIESDDITGLEKLKKISDGFNKIQAYYEAVCRHENLHLPYVK
ncbi:MAG: hypothetical protein QM647_19040 [Asticcacaulis sp.]|uniref:DUF6968 family protein n=1 Tax=Asticcacaulis sp. TaxID=1872648 RepID=UPI0039E3E22C